MCGSACAGYPTKSRGKKLYYYACAGDRTGRRRGAPAHHAPYIRAEWIEGLIWQDVKRFLENPGEVLERVREQLSQDEEADELAERYEDLTNRLAEKQAEKDRYVRLYAQGHINESELEVYLADLTNQMDNLRLLIESVEADLVQKWEHRELAETTEAWLGTLQERIADVERRDTEEALQVRRELMKLLVERLIAGRREDGKLSVLK